MHDRNDLLIRVFVNNEFILHFLKSLLSVHLSKETPYRHQRNAYAIRNHRKDMICQAREISMQ